MRRAGGLGGEPRLADARLAGEQHHLALPVLCLGPRERERLRFFVLRPNIANGDRLPRRGGSGTPASTSGSHATAQATTGSGRPLSASGPMGAKVWPPRPRARTRTMSATRICPPSAAAQSRAASTSGMPWGCVSSHATSPALMPTRMRDRRLRAASAAGHDRLLDRDRRRHGIGRAGERGHDAVAEVVVERAAVGRDVSARSRLMRLPLRLGALFPERRAQRRRADEIREEDRRGAGRGAGG